MVALVVSNPESLNMENAQEIRTTLEGAGRRAGEAQRNGDAAMVRHWGETLTYWRKRAKDAGIDADAIYREAYQEGYGPRRPQYFR
jgi:hypothetical protein